MNVRILMSGAAIFLLGATGCATGGRASSELAFAAPSAFAEQLPVVEAQGGAIKVGERTLWESPGDGPIDGVRVRRTPDGQGFAVVFRQADSIWLGLLGSAAEPTGGLRRLNGRGRRVGTPHPRVEGPLLVVAWSDGDMVAQVGIEQRPR